MTHSNQYYYPYEPTSYRVLERLANSEYITKKNTLLDYGTGKGRVCFYMSNQTGCKSIGIEYDERIYFRAVENQMTAVSGKRISFVKENAEKYQVPIDVDSCYFFNPFSVKILPKVLARIFDSYYENPREIKMFFYYPSHEYVGYLIVHEQLVFVGEIDCRDIFDGNNAREKILIFKVV